MATIDVDGGPKKAEQPAAADATKAEPPKYDLEVTKDTATRGDKTSGLGRVLVQMDSIALGDDIADVVLTALKAAQAPTPWRIRVVDDPDALRGAETLALLRYRADRLTEAVQAAAPPIPVPPAQQPARASLAIPTAAAAAVGLQAAGILGKLLAHEYQLSGAAVPVDGLGFDLLVAHWLQFKHRAGVAVSVDRVAPTAVTGSAIFAALAVLDDLARTDLATAVGKAAVVATEAKDALAALTAARDALEAQVIELVKLLDKDERVATELKRSREEIAGLDGTIATARETAAKAQAKHDDLAALAKEVAEFLTAATTAPADGTRAPIIAAARAEAAGGDGAYVLYARLLAGGMDEIVDTRPMRSDTWTGLAGAAAEFALVDGGRLVAGGVRSALETTAVNLAHPDKVTQARVAYASPPDFVP